MLTHCSSKKAKGIAHANDLGGGFMRGMDLTDEAMVGVLKDEGSMAGPMVRFCAGS